MFLMCHARILLSTCIAPQSVWVRVCTVETLSQTYNPVLEVPCLRPPALSVHSVNRFRVCSNGVETLNPTVTFLMNHAHMLL